MFKKIFFKKRILKKLNKELVNSELAEYVEYAVLTGGFILSGNAKGDLDLIIVLNDKYSNDKEIFKKIKKFSLGHFRIQTLFGFKPDLDFPTYIFSRSQINDILNSRPFTKDINERIFLATYSVKEWENNQESDYRVVLYQLISHNFDLFFGDKKKLKEDTKKSFTNNFFIWI